MDELKNKIEERMGKKAGFQFQLKLVAAKDGTTALRYRLLTIRAAAWLASSRR
jgi:hypothetical protein